MLAGGTIVKVEQQQKSEVGVVKTKKLAQLARWTKWRLTKSP